MAVPTTIYAGDTVKWTDDRVPDDATGVVVWFRTNAAGAGVSVSGAKVDDKWTFTISGGTTLPMVAGPWLYQAVATLPDGSATYDTGRVQVQASLSYTGTPTAVDTRSQAERDLEAVEEAIRVIQSGAQSYTIGTGSGGRTFNRAQLSQLIAWRERLLVTVAAERRAAGTGRTDRRILVRFD